MQSYCACRKTMSQGMNLKRRLVEGDSNSDGDDDSKIDN